MTIAGSVGGDVKTAMSRVVQNIPANVENNESSEAVRIENGEGDREILDIQVTARLTDIDDLSEEDQVNLTADGGAYFGSTDRKPAAQEYVDETNYMGRFQNTFIYSTRHDSSNGSASNASLIEGGPVRLMPGDDITRDWPEGVTLTTTLSSVTSFADVEAADNIKYIVDFVIYYKESGSSSL